MIITKISSYNTSKKPYNECPICGEPTRKVLFLGTLPGVACMDCAYYAGIGFRALEKLTAGDVDGYVLVEYASRADILIRLPKFALGVIVLGAIWVLQKKDKI